MNNYWQYQIYPFLMHSSEKDFQNGPKIKILWLSVLEGIKKTLTRFGQGKMKGKE